jgi:hypothetical protein
MRRDAVSAGQPACEGVSTGPGGALIDLVMRRSRVRIPKAAPHVPVRDMRALREDRGVPFLCPYGNILGTGTPGMPFLCRFFGTGIGSLQTPCTRSVATCRPVELGARRNRQGSPERCSRLHRVGQPGERHPASETDETLASVGLRHVAVSTRHIVRWCDAWGHRSDQGPIRARHGGGKDRRPR